MPVFSSEKRRLITSPGDGVQILRAAAGPVRDVFGEMRGNHLAARVGQREMAPEPVPALVLVALLDEVDLRALPVREQKCDEREVEPGREVQILHRGLFRGVQLRQLAELRGHRFIAERQLDPQLRRSSRRTGKGCPAASSTPWSTPVPVRYCRLLSAHRES